MKTTDPEEIRLMDRVYILQGRFERDWRSLQKIVTRMRAYRKEQRRLQRRIELARKERRASARSRGNGLPGGEI